MELEERYEEVLTRIEEARQRGAGQEVELIGVSKTHGVEKIQALYDLGLRSFGESYVQEWLEKKDELPQDIRWHFIGGLQSNKARFLTEQIRLIHSVDRKSLAKALHRRSNSESVPILLQVNLGGEESKGGVAPEKLLSLVEVILNYESLQICGVMGLPPYREDQAEIRPFFKELKESLFAMRLFLEDRSPANVDAAAHLSMGMSHDFETAIEEGATMVRLGTILFGERDG